MTAPYDLFLDCFSGCSGDMWVGALLDLGWSEKDLRQGLHHLGLDHEYHLHISRQTRQNLSGSKFAVHVGHHHPPADSQSHSHSHSHSDSHAHSHAHGRNFREIRTLLESSGLPEEVLQRAVSVFHRIAVAEGKIHGLPPEEVAFHEVGAVDSIVDIVAGCLGLHELGISRVRASALCEGTGEIVCAHGLLPLPAPATLEILAGIPVRQIDFPHEMITPTGAALLAEFCLGFGAMPAMQTTRIGYGLGTRDTPPRPNVLRAVLGHFVETESLPGGLSDEIVELQTNLDDCSPEILAAAAEALRQAGALEVFFTAVQTKKHRPAWQLTVLSSPTQAHALAASILEQTTSFGVRWSTRHRLILRREVVSFSSSLGSVAVKLGWWEEQLWQIAPEFASVQELAQRTQRPVREVWERITAEARLHFQPANSAPTLSTQPSLSQPGFPG